MNLLQNTEYKHWLKDLKQKVLHAQLKTVVKVNSTLLEFYWELAEVFVFKQNQAYWCDSFLKQFTQIPWGHNLKIIEKCQNVNKQGDEYKEVDS